MSQARAISMSDEDDIPLIEERIDTGLDAVLKEYRSNYTPGGTNRDELDGRFQIHVNRPIPEFDHALGKAYAVTDSTNPQRQVYAMVLDNTLPYRSDVIDKLQSFQNAHLTIMLGSGTVRLSHLNESRQVMLFDRPGGKKLSDILKTQPRMHEHAVIDKILQPLCKALIALRDKNVVHGSINPDNIYIGDELVLGECASAPCGYLQPFLYEPLERMMCDPIAKGVGDEKADVYAVGMLAYELIYGLDRVKNIPKEQLITMSLDIGIYHALSNNIDFSDALADFFRGIFNDNLNERWNIEQLSQWLNGKRFNMIVPPAPRESARSMSFIGREFYSRKSIANALHRNWKEALKEVKNIKIDRWCEMSIHRPELAEKLERVLRIGGEASTEKNNADMLTRLLAILDSVGPVRTQNLCMRPEGYGLQLAEFMRRNNPPEMNQLLDTIEQDIPNYWATLLESSKSQELSQAIWRLQRCRSHMKIKSLGFGLERLLYDLNPTLPCQSPLVKQYHITTLTDLLKTLDALAHQLAPDTTLVDRHIAAFIAAKIDITKEVKLTDLSVIPVLAKNPELIVLRILTKAQQRNDKMHLVGLTTWAAMRVEKMLDEIHNRVIRKRMKMELKPAAQDGLLGDIVSIIVNRDAVSRDHDGFAMAISLYSINKKRIERLRDAGVVGSYARHFGGQISTTISYIILTIMGYVVLADFLGWG
jgi:serine/threonine protein kinase